MKIIFTSPKLQGKILFEFNTNGFIKSFEIETEEDANEKFIRWMFRNFPVHEQALESDIFKKLFTIAKVHGDLSFPAFWEAYGYKVGNKKRAERIWDALSDVERAQALANCKRYKQYLSLRPNMEQAYAETWLTQRRFENNYV